MLLIRTGRSSRPARPNPVRQPTAGGNITAISLASALLCFVGAVTLLGCVESFTLIRYLDGTDIEDTDIEKRGSLLSLSPDELVVTTGTETTFIAGGGLPPYHYAVMSGPGSIDADTGLFTATVDGSVAIQGTDSRGSTAEARVVVKYSIAAGMWTSPVAAALEVGESFFFHAGGGDGKYSYNMKFDGQLDADTGEFTATLSPTGYGFAVVEIHDGSSAVTYAIVKIDNPAEKFAVSPPFVVMHLGEKVTFTSTGAAEPEKVIWTADYIASDPVMSTGPSQTYKPVSTGFAYITAEDSDGFQVYRPVLVIDP